MNIIANLLISLSLIFSMSAWATEFRDCGQNFYQSTAPDYINQNLLKQSVPLCFNGFATLYSGVTRTPLWSAEYLTRNRLSRAEEILERTAFHSESRLLSRMQAQLDHKGSGYDRGHLAPNADMANKKAQQYDSFSLG